MVISVPTQAIPHSIKVYMLSLAIMVGVTVLGYSHVPWLDNTTLVKPQLHCLLIDADGKQIP